MTEALTRRDFLALSAAGLAASSAALGAAAPKKLYAYVSSWTKGPGFGKGGGGGVSVFTVNMTDGSLVPVSRTGPEFDNLNGGGLGIAPNGRFLYVTNEVGDLDGKRGAGGGVLAFAINQQDGSLTHLNTQSSLGTDACNLAIDATGTRVLVANHGSAQPVIRIVKKNGVPEVQNLFDHGSVVMFIVKPDGSLEPACDAAPFGEEVGPVSQAPGQAHSVYIDPSNRFVVACDVGADHLYQFRFDPASRSLGTAKVFPTPPGRATRHGAFHPRLPYFFVINERESSLSSFRFDANTGDLQMIQTVPTVVEGYSGARNAPADIRVHPNGKFVYGGNRGDESIAVFRLDEKTGQLTPVEIVKTQGAAREFNFDPSGKFLFAANPQSNAVVTFAVDPDTGKMTPTGAKAEVPKPVCVHFAML